MNKLFLYALLLGLFSSCASKKGPDKLTREIEEEYEDIEDTDFIMVDEIPYRRSEDKFDEVEEVSDVLAEESIERFRPDKLDDMADSKKSLSSGIASCHLGNIEEGLLKLKKQHRKYKTHPTYWNQLGSCYYKKGNSRLSLLYYNKSKKLGKGRYAPPLNNIGVIYFAQEKYQKALLAFEEASKISKFSLTPVYNLASLYLKFYQVDRSLKLFESLQRNGGYDKDVFSALGTLYLLNGDFNRSIEIYEQLKEDDLELPYIGLNYSLSLFFAGNKTRARGVYSSLGSTGNKRLLQYYRKVGKILEGS